MLHFELTPQMKEYLRQQMVLTDFELRQRLKQKRRQLLQTIAECETEIVHIDTALDSLTDETSGNRFALG